jgi:hypothetical protein
MLHFKTAKAYLESLEDGIQMRIRRLDRNFWEGNDQELVMHPWNKVDLTDVLSEVEDVCLSYDGPLEYESMESNNLAKFGPRSVQVPGRERLDGLKAYWDFPDLPRAEAYQSFKGIAKDTDLVTAFLKTHTGGNLRLGSLHPVGRELAQKSLKASSTSGLPYMVKKKNLTPQNLHEAWADWDNESEIPMLLFTRTQEDKKTRPVMGVPVSTTLGEMRYYLPYQSVERNLSFRSALLTPDAIRTSTSNWVNRSGHLLSLDYSAFDTTVSPELIYTAFGLMALLFDSKHSDELFRIAEHFVTIPLYLDGQFWFGNHGIPSGSTFTNAIGSLVSWIVCFRAARDLNPPSNSIISAEIQGDDGLVYFGDVFGSLVEDVKREFIEAVGTYGLVINDGKSHFSSEYCMYLQHLTHKEMPRATNGELSSVYSGIRAFNRIVHPERYPTLVQDYGITESGAMKLRTLMILNQLVSHPMSHQLNSIIRKYDPQTFSGDVSQQDKSRFKSFLQDRRAVGLGNFMDDLS